LDLKYEHSFFKNTSGEIGINSTYQRNSWQGRFFIPNFYKKSLGAYVIEIIKWKKWEFEAGMRVDYSKLNVFISELDKVNQYKHQFQKMSSALGFSKTFGHHLEIKTNLASAWRTPSINELYSNGLHHGAAAIEIGNRNLKIEESYSVQSSLIFKSVKVNCQIDIYHNQINGFIYLKPSLVPQLTIKGAFPVFEFEQVNARFSGIDFYFASKIIDQIDFSLKSSIVRAFNLTSKTYLVGIPADRFEPNLAYKKEFKSGNKFIFSLSLPIFRTQNRIEANSDYVAPPKGYYLINVQCIYSLKIKKQTVDFSAEISNLTNTIYRDYMNRFRYFSDEIGRNFGLKISYDF
jgi:iron complex outermembrane receptor protein